MPLFSTRSIAKLSIPVLLIGGGLSLSLGGAVGASTAHHHQQAVHHHDEGGSSQNKGDHDNDGDEGTSSGPTTRYVSGTAAVSSTDASCTAPGYASIGAAVTASVAGDTIIVCSGTYKEDVTVGIGVTLLGQDATVDATGLNNGFHITASNATVSGFTVENAVGEGILVGTPGVPVSTASAVSEITDVSVTQNVVTGNDLGAFVASPTYPECQPAGQVPGDCGEGIHLVGVANSSVWGNYVSNNAGGVLLTDESGPTDNNLIAHNVITNNLFDCGITIAAHNPNGFNPATSTDNGTVAGVFDNHIEENVVTGNGVKGEGAGVIFAGAGPGTAVYGNIVKGNVFAGNELAGVALHAHSPAVDLNGNEILGNQISVNNLGGDQPNAPMGASDKFTTGILVYSAAVPVSITIRDNAISDNSIGIWLTNTVTATGLDDNTFVGVGTNVFVSAP